MNRNGHWQIGQLTVRQANSITLRDSYFNSLNRLLGLLAAQEKSTIFIVAVPFTIVIGAPAPAF